MEEGDGETFYAMFALHFFHWRPQEFIMLPLREKAAVVAMIDRRLADMKRRH